MRRGTRLPLEALTPHLLEAAQPHGATQPLADQDSTPLVWGSVFGNANPVEIEVGFGKGLGSAIGRRRFGGALAAEGLDGLGQTGSVAGFHGDDFTVAGYAVLRDRRGDQAVFRGLDADEGSEAGVMVAACVPWTVTL